MRLKAVVTQVTGRTRHFLGGIREGQLEKVKELPPPAWVEIHEEPEGYYLLRFDANGSCLTDTWHSTLEEAQSQGTFEYGLAADDWEIVESP